MGQIHPSIEDKVVRFSDKVTPSLLEPEGLSDDTVYLMVFQHRYQRHSAEVY